MLKLHELLHQDHYHIFTLPHYHMLTLNGHYHKLTPNKIWAKDILDVTETATALGFGRHGAFESEQTKTSGSH